MLDDFLTLAAKCADKQHQVLTQADDAAMHHHITATLQRCLPARIVTAALVEQCFQTLRLLPGDSDPMHTGAIHAWAAQYLLDAAADDPLVLRLHHAAVKLLPAQRPASRDDLRLVTLDALYQPGLLPAGMHLAFLRHRLGLNGHPRLSCEEIAVHFHQPLTRIYETEAALLTFFSIHNNGGLHA